jgi:hypothetical protein
MNNMKKNTNPKYEEMEYELQDDINGLKLFYAHDFKDAPQEIDDEAKWIIGSIEEDLLEISYNSNGPDDYYRLAFSFVEKTWERMNSLFETFYEE